MISGELLRFKLFGGLFQLINCEKFGVTPNPTILKYGKHTGQNQITRWFNIQLIKLQFRYWLVRQIK